MGWQFTPGQSRQQLIHKRLHRDWIPGFTGTCLKHSLRGNVLWSVWELRRPDGSEERYIACDSLAFQAGSGWSFKATEESAGPCQYSCPLLYLEMAAGKNETWREHVRAYHRERKIRRRMFRHLRIGDTVPLERCAIPEAQIVSLNPLQGFYRGRIYELRRSLLSMVTERVTA